jgi:hypothetical protein
MGGLLSGFEQVEMKAGKPSLTHYHTEPPPTLPLTRLLLQCHPIGRERSLTTLDLLLRADEYIRVRSHLLTWLIAGS